MNSSTEHRRFLMGYSIEELKETEDKPDENQKSDQQKNIPVPDVQKPVPDDAKLIDLVHPDKIDIGNAPLFDIIRQRKSRRRFTDEYLTIKELSFLLFTTQGIQKILFDKNNRPRSTFRTVPSGGSRHPFETYIYVNRVDGVACGLYRYLPIEHKLLFMFDEPSFPQKLSEGCCGQSFVGTGAVVFIWTVIPYRMEWRYKTFGTKIIAQDSGHLCQNLYLASEAIGCGTCAIGAYFQESMDALLKVDGVDEFTIYVAPVGKLRQVKFRSVDTKILETYSGEYFLESRPELVVTIFVENGKLYLMTRDQMRFELKPLSEKRFLVEIMEDEFEFTSDKKAGIAGFVVEQGGEKRIFTRRN